MSNNEIMELIEQLKELICDCKEEQVEEGLEIDKDLIIQDLKQQLRDSLSKNYFSFSKEEDKLTKQDKNKRDTFMKFLNGKGRHIKDFLYDQLENEKEELELKNKNLKKEVEKKEDKEKKKGYFFKK